MIPIVDPRSLPRTFPLRVPLSNARALSLVKTFSSKLLLKIFPTKSATSFIHFHFNVVNAKKKYHRSNAKGLATKGTKNDFTSAISIDVIFSSINFSKGFLLLFLRLRATKIPLLNNDAFYLTVRCLERSRLTSISPPPSHCVRPTVSRTD